MLTDVQKKWVEALRSGKYAQTKERLCRMTPEGPAFCCLGVLCDLYIQKHPGQAGWDDPLHDRLGVYIPLSLGGRVYGSALPAEVCTWAGVTCANGVHGNTSLWAANDSGTDFQAIADLIESEPEGLFVEAEDE